MADKLIIEIDLEKGDVSKATKEISNELEKSGKKSASKFSKAFKKDISGNLKSIAGTAAKATAAITALGAGITTALAVKGVRAAQVQEDAINALNTALSLSKNAGADASQGIQNFASELQQVTRFGDEALIQNAALIQSLGDLDEKGLKGATKAAADLATALRIDLGSAATLVGKAAAGEVGSFSRFGLTIEKGKDKAETFARALDAINSKFGGAAERDVNTYSGAVQQLENAFGDVFEEIGFLITKNPAFVKTIKATTNLFVEAGKQINKFGAEFDLFETITSTLVRFNEAFITYVIAPFELLTNIGKLVQSSINNNFAQVIKGLGFLGGKLAQFLESINVGESISKDLKIFQEASSETAEETSVAVRKALDNIFNFDMSASLAEKNEKLRMFFEEQIRIAQEASEKRGTIIANENATAQESVIGLTGVFSEVGSAFSTSADQVAAKAQEVNKKVKKFAQESGTALRTGIAQGAGRAFAEFGKALVTGENALEAFTRSFLKAIAEQAIALGTRFILEGTAYAFVPGYQALSGPLIAAGAALAAFGGALGALSGGGSDSGGGGGAAAVSGTDQAFADTNQELASPELAQEAEERVNLSLNIEGSLVRESELNGYITNLLEEGSSRDANIVPSLRTG